MAMPLIIEIPTTDVRPPQRKALRIAETRDVRADIGTSMTPESADAVKLRRTAACFCAP